MNKDGDMSVSTHSRDHDKGCPIKFNIIHNGFQRLNPMDLGSLCPRM